MCLPLLLALGKSHIERFANDDSPVHLCDCLGGFLGRRETYETKSLGVATLVSHHLGTGDGAKLGKLLSQSLIVHNILKVLHIEVHSLESE